MAAAPGKKLLWDAHDSACHIGQITTGQSFQGYLANDLMRWAVERQFMIIDEALSVLRRVDPVLAGQIPDRARIVALRNVLVHGYSGVVDRLVWGVNERELASLRAARAELIGPSPDPG
jgi:uncharacterized protein with HEPN domain